MAVKRLTIDGYGQIELNNVAFRRDGRVEAQCALDATDFATLPAENGMLLAVDKANKVIKFPTDDSLPIALHYSTEHLYDERTPGLKNFKLTRGTGSLKGDNFYPRLGYLSVGETFTTNTIAYSDAEFEAVDAEGVDNDKTAEQVFLEEVKDGYKTTPYYGRHTVTADGANVKGCIVVTATKPTDNVYLKVVDVYTMPDGQTGFKFQVIKA